MMVMWQSQNFSLNHNSPKDFIVSQWQHDDDSINRKYLIYRWLAATYFNFVVILSFITAVSNGQLGFYIIYLTNWNVLLNGTSSLLGAVIVTLCHQNVIKLHNRLPRLIKIYWLLSNLSTVVAISISIVYWSVLYTGRDKGLNDTLTHAGNSIVLFFDVLIVKHPARFSHVIYSACFGMIYGIVFCIPYTYLGGTDRDYNNFIYSILDFRSNPFTAWLVTIGAIILLSFLHCFITVMHLFRAKMHMKLTTPKAQLPLYGYDNNQINIASES